MLVACRDEVASVETVKPTIHVLTSLPLLFDDGFGLSPATGPAASYLRGNYTLKPIDLPSQLPQGAVLFAAQPRALPAEELVALDAWVRGGGNVLLLADPLLEWPSKRGLGDRLRPPIQFADTGLLTHWGLRLDTPDRTFYDAHGLAKGMEAGGFRVAGSDPGSLHKVGNGNCVIESGGAIARCSIGKGQATIIADADFLNAGDGEVSPGKRDNLQFLLAELDALFGRPSSVE